MSKVKWLPEALTDIERLYRFLHDKSPQAASRAASVILDGTQLLETSPRIGRLMPDETGRRELFLPFAAGAYVLRYIVADAVVVVRVWHSREFRSEPHEE